jgi:hypothetical protein
MASSSGIIFIEGKITWQGYLDKVIDNLMKEQKIIEIKIFG